MYTDEELDRRRKEYSKMASDCPYCKGKKTAVPVVYGLAMEPLFQLQREGFVQLGGCLAPSDHAGGMSCKKCGKRWRAKRQRKAH